MRAISSFLQVIFNSGPIFLVCIGGFALLLDLRRSHPWAARYGLYGSALIVLSIIGTGVAFAAVPSVQSETLVGQAQSAEVAAFYSMVSFIETCVWAVGVALLFAAILSGRDRSIVGQVPVPPPALAR